MTPSTRIDGEAFLLEAKCDACNREPGLLMCALCEALTVAEMFPVGAEPDKDDGDAMLLCHICHQPRTAKGAWFCSAYHGPEWAL